MANRDCEGFLARILQHIRKLNKEVIMASLNADTSPSQCEEFKLEVCGLQIDIDSASLQGNLYLQLKLYHAGNNNISFNI